MGKLNYPEHECCWHDVETKHFPEDLQVCCKCLEWKKKEGPCGMKKSCLDCRHSGNLPTEEPCLSCIRNPDYPSLQEGFEPKSQKS